MKNSMANGESSRPTDAEEPATAPSTRSLLLRAALKLFRERGYHGAGTNEIGAAIGMTGPSIYRHFTNKDDLLVAAVREGARQLAVGAAVADQEPDPATALQILCSSFVEVAVNDPDGVCVYFFESRHLPPESRSEVDRPANLYLHSYERVLVQLRPDLGQQEAHIRVDAALRMVAGVCMDLPDMAHPKLAAMLVQRMLVILLNEVEPV
jgi:AcrR family transcriptional regulator